MHHVGEGVDVWPDSYHVPRPVVMSDRRCSVSSPDQAIGSISEDSSQIIHGRSSCPQLVTNSITADKMGFGLIAGLTLGDVDNIRIPDGIRGTLPPYPLDSMELIRYAPKCDFPPIERS